MGQPHKPASEGDMNRWSPTKHKGTEEGVGSLRDGPEWGLGDSRLL